MSDTPAPIEILKELSDQGCNGIAARLTKISLMPSDEKRSADSKLLAIEYVTYFGAKEALLISPHQLREAVHILFNIALDIGAIEPPQPSINLCPCCEAELLDEADCNTKH